MQVHYLEVVAADVDLVCRAFEDLHGVCFSDPHAELGNARVAELLGGGRIGVRAPMHEAEPPIVRPYFQTSDIGEAVRVAEKAGCEIAHPPFEIPGLGKFAIYIQSGVQMGLWEV